MSVRFGASRAEWEAFASLNLSDLLPWVADPNTPIHPTSSLTSGQTKTPSYVIQDKRGFGAIGILDWASPQRRTTSVHDWMDDERLGICMQARAIKCIDIDVPDLALAREIEATIREELGIAGMMMPLRDREGTGKRALMYRLGDGVHGDYQRILVGEGEGLIEFLGDTRQFVVAGMHKDGNPYRWPEGIPKQLSDIPAFNLERIVEVYNLLIREFAPKGYYREWKYTDGRISRERKVGKFDNNPVVKYLLDNDLVVGFSPHNGVYVKCPWEHMHSPDSTKDDAAEYFPAGSNGRKEQGFKCFHGHSQGDLSFEPTYVEFLDAIGYRGQEIDAEFEVVTTVAGDVVPAPSQRPKFTFKGRSAIIESTMANVVNMLRWAEGGGYHICYDRFKDKIIYRAVGTDRWQEVDDDTYTMLRIAFSMKGMEQPSHETMQRAVSFIAREQAIDSAQEWLMSKQWDGVHRLATFHTDVLGLEDTEYHHAVVEYMWTALVGRVMEPGCKVDMVPILTGPQGLRKSSFVEALAFSFDEYTAVSLAERDENLSRQLRGRIVVEWDELRGLNSRELEALKGWVTRRKDDWIPKFKEFGTSLLRRFLMIGTANPKRFLNDPTGLRRWLPVKVERMIDVDYVIDNRDQLWAEAHELYKCKGILWQRAEALAKDAQKDASIRDPWVDAVDTWFASIETIGPFTTLEILNQACNVPIPQINFGTQERLRRVMSFMNWDEETNGSWSPPFA